MNPPPHPPLSTTDRSTVRRGRKRAVTEREALWSVLDAGLVCHLSTVVDGAPLVLPTGYGRAGDTMFVHGSTGALSLRTAAAGVEVCVAVTVLDGLVYARSVFHHSMNYRSAVVHGTAVPVTDEDAKAEGLRVITEHLTPGSWDHARPPSRRELAKTAVLSIDLAEAAVKIRAGGPGDDPEDVAADTAWAGHVPLVLTRGTPVPADDLPGTWSAPDHVVSGSRTRA
ncbi:pyridoxamine 5'-phosphate oxidase family protein [Actinokineospora sp. G85]|uniref:pyridoxamine 5'-phosphate oxidase family protein n=1 Tax=Actinokineospora sp. G85 TaxID=3406626 RepID=UPI003C708819